MSEEAEIQKTPQDHIHDIVSRLKEMEHYSRSNIEKLGADWFKLDEELKLKDCAKAFEPLMDAQNLIQELLLPLIEQLEEAAVEQGS